MRRGVYFCWLLGVCGLYHFAYAQDTMLRPMGIAVAENKTTHLLFDHSIQSVDLGHADLLAQINDEMRHILAVKARKEGMTTTTLTVITSEGGFYSFLVRYDSLPDTLNWRVPKVAAIESVPVGENGWTEAEVNGVIERLKQPGPSLFSVRTGKGLVDLQWKGIYVHGEVYYLKGWIRNRTYRTLRFAPFQFMVEGKSKSRRGRRPGTEVIPLLPSSNPEIRLMPGERHWWVRPLPTLDMLPTEVLVIRIEEKGGSRILEIRVSAKRWERALPLDRSGY